MSRLLLSVLLNRGCGPRRIGQSWTFRKFLLLRQSILLQQSDRHWLFLSLIDRGSIAVAV